METHTSLPKLSILSIYEYRAFDTDKKIEILESKGILVDDHIGQETSVYLYYLSGFFVEVSVATQENKVTGISPFQRTFEMGVSAKSRLRA